jgi:ATP-dependent DNA helicase RecG
MDQAALKSLLESLIASWEDEVVEFKQAGDGFSTDEIGKYFSALANEANLRGPDAGWLVFGVNNKSRGVVGTEYRPEPERLQSLNMQIAQSTEPSITLRCIHELQHLPVGECCCWKCLRPRVACLSPGRGTTTRVPAKA